MNSKVPIDQAAMLDKVVIAHPALVNALQGVEDCVAKTHAFREPVGSLLLAQGGMGKSTVCRTLMSRMPRTTALEGHYEKTIIPAFYAEIPSPATVKTVAANMLAKLNDPSPHSGNTAQMTSRLVRLLDICETRLVFLDELHHLFDIRKTSTRINVNVCNWIKSLVNQTKVSFCLVGLPQVAPILYSDSQLARRFPMRYELSSLRVADSTQPGTLSAFLAEVMHQVRARTDLKKTLSLEADIHALQVFAATGGSPAYVMALVKEAILHALKTSSKNLSVDDFANAWDMGVSFEASLTKNNPFRMKMGELSGLIRG